MKKTLSLILAIILTFSMSTLAFAGDAVALTKEEARAKAIAHVHYEKEYEVGTYVLNDTYTDDLQGEVEVYDVTSRLLLFSGRTVTYNTKVDKYSGKIYYQKATIVDLPALFDFSEDTALNLAIEVLGVNKDNTSVLSETPNSDGSYSFVFVEGYSQKYECTVVKSNLAVVVDNINVSLYNQESVTSTNIVERIVLVLKVLIAKLNITNLLEKISAADMLKLFQFLAK